MRVAIYSPYLDTAGGGEKYMLSIAEILSFENEVEVLLDNHLFSLGDQNIKTRNEKLHNLDLSRVKFIKAPVGAGDSFLDRFLFLRKYDWFFSNTDGGIPYSSAKNSVLHFQVPFENIDALGFWGKARQSSWKLAICNSEFTKSIVTQNFMIACRVVYPPINVLNFKPLKKKRQILTVGRFRKEKKQKFLIQVFKKMVDEYKISDWSFHIAGGMFVSDKELLDEMKNLAHGYEVYFHENIEVSELVKLYGESAIYWHATGFEESDPKLFEHFGISTVESMASGCVPVVIKKGGQIEIIEEDVSGLFWENEQQLIDKTLKVIKDTKLQNRISNKAIKRSRLYSKEIFNSKIKKIVYAN